jgi:hypothetical protein
MSLTLRVTTSTPPAGFCFLGFEQSWADLVSLLYVTIPDDVSPVNYGSSVPDPDQRGNPWFVLTADGYPAYSGYASYKGGNWWVKHASAPGTVVMYEGTEASIPTFDGGEVGVATVNSGPMWERVTEMDAKFPIGPGTLPSTTVLGVGATGGEETHTLTAAEIPEHSHSMEFDDDTTGAGFPVQAGNGEDSIATYQTSKVGSDQAHNNMPPYRVIWFIRKTVRLYYRV